MHGVNIAYLYTDEYLLVLTNHNYPVLTMAREKCFICLDLQYVKAGKSLNEQVNRVSILR
jgi:hypothetical protein